MNIYDIFFELNNRRMAALTFKVNSEGTLIVTLKENKKTERIEIPNLEQVDCAVDIDSIGATAILEDLL